MTDHADYGRVRALLSGVDEEDLEAATAVALAYGDERAERAGHFHLSCAAWLAENEAMRAVCDAAAAWATIGSKRYQPEEIHIENNLFDAVRAWQATQEDR